MNLTAPIYDRLTSDAVLLALLGTFGVDSVGDALPAIFLDMPYVPEDAPLPYLWNYANLTDAPDDTKTEPGRQISFDIGCYTANEGNKQLVTTIAERVSDLFHRHELAIDGAITVVASAMGPVPAETDETVLGLLIKVQLRIEETG